MPLNPSHDLTSMRWVAVELPACPRLSSVVTKSRRSAWSRGSFSWRRESGVVFVWWQKRRRERA